MPEHTTAHRAKHHDEIAPLLELCKAGQLFAVQDWIAQGKPVNPALVTKGYRRKSPLELAIERGFHSLVEVLLQGGAIQEPVGHNSPINQALRARRSDIVKLLVVHGFDPKSIDMTVVFGTWDSQLMHYFIEQGADVRTDNPFAREFCERIRTSLNVFKECRGRWPDLQEQANIALRYHCKEGNLKWVSLMLWAGADPFKCGSDDPNQNPDDDDHCLSALAYAALYRHFEIFELKAIRSKAVPSEAVDIFKYLTRERGLDVLKKWLTLGLCPNDQVNGGSSTIQHCLEDMSWNTWSVLYGNRNERDIDTSESRDKLKAIHILAKFGGKWIPGEKDQINSARRSLLKMKPDYTLEFTWIMSYYKACNCEDMQSLIGTPTMKSHMSLQRSRLLEIMKNWDTD